MNKLFLCLLLLSTPAFADEWQVIVANTANSVPRMEMIKGDLKSSCSAVVFKVDLEGNAHALTAGHCVDVAPDERLDITVSGKNAEVKLSNKLLDLAIIKYRAGKAKAITIYEGDPLPGSGVAVIGYPFGTKEIAFQFGHVSQPKNPETEDMILDAKVIFGDSGGAIIDPQGRLIGICNRIYSAGPIDVGAAVRGEQIRDYIDFYEDKIKKESK